MRLGRTIEIVQAEVLTVAPDEVLIIWLPGDWPTDIEEFEAVRNDLQAFFNSVGITDDRWLILQGEMELAKVKKYEEVTR